MIAPPRPTDKPTNLKDVFLTRLEKTLYRIKVIPTSNMFLPDFLGIGAQKSGTSWLYENLKTHPELYLPDQKELHYFDWHFNESLRSYARTFMPGIGRLKGEITPGYSIISPQRIRFIRAIMPHVKLILLLRNPIDRAWSQALMNLVVLPQKRFEDVSKEEFYSHFSHPRSIHRGNYPQILKHWLTVFPRRQMYVGFFEDIATQPRKLLGNIFDYLEVSRDVSWDSFPLNRTVFGGPGIEMPSEFMAFLENMYKNDLQTMRTYFGHRIDRWINHRAI